MKPCVPILPFPERFIRLRSAAAMRLPTALFLLLVLLRPAALAASLQFDLHAGPLQGGIQLDDLPLPQGRASVGVAWSEGLSASLYLRHTTAFGPVGNVILELQAGGSSGGTWRTHLTARGVAGPVAARARFSAGNDPALLLAGPASSLFPAAPQLPGNWRGLELGGTWRPAAALLLDFNSSVFTAAAATGWTLSGEVRLLRQADSHDLLLGAEAYLLSSADGAAGSGALRIGRQFNERRAAPWQANLLFGAGPAYVGPGLRISGARQFGQAELKLAAAAEFWRLDAAPLQLHVQLQQPLDAGQLTAAAGLDWSSATQVSARLQLSYRLPLGP